jgi:hypothetical protein
MALLAAGSMASVRVGVAVAATPGDPAAPRNLLDDSIVDVAALAQVGPDGSPNLLNVDPVAPGSTTVGLSILERGGTWRQAAATTIDLATDGITAFEQPWLIGLGGDRFAMLATSVASERTVIVIVVASDEAGRRVVQERQRTVVDVVVDDAGAADVAGDGVPDLVIVTIPSNHDDVLCVGSGMRVYPDGRLDAAVDHKIPGLRLAAGVIGSFDAVAGDDLAAFAYPDCSIDHPSRDVLRLSAVRLSDGAILHDETVLGKDFLAKAANPPVRFDLDGDGHHELFAMTTQGLSVIDPMRDWSKTQVASISAFPLAVAPVAESDGTMGQRVAWLEPSAEGRAFVGAVPVQRAADGDIASGSTTIMWAPGVGDERWRLIATSASMAAIHQAPAVGWTSGWPAGCPDTLVNAAVLPCGTGGIDPGPGWIGTRPLLLMPGDGAPRVLVASGLERDQRVNLPAMPVPWAGFSPGAWRYGPSTPFALGEVDGETLSPGRPLGRPTIEPVAAAGPAVTVHARSGMRLLMDVAAEAAAAPDPAADPKLRASLSAAGTPLLLRVPVAPGDPSGYDRATVQGALEDVPSGDDQAAARWRVTAIPLSDAGELEAPVAAAVRLDQTAPTLTLPVPGVTSIWPVAATLTGTTEPGATVAVEGVTDVVVQGDGKFSFRSTLAPWPQSFRVVATDPVGNQTVQTLTLVGGVDYRSFPWAAIIAITVLAGVIVSGVFGTRRRTGPLSVVAARGAWDDAPGGPELEELPPGGGL